MNDLNGSIPSTIFNMSTLKTLDLSRNQFSGSLPPTMGLPQMNLEELCLTFNKLSGEIPNSIINASQLTALEMSSNSFTGLIPDFGNLRLLHTLRFWDNDLSGVESPTRELTFMSSLTKCRDLKYLSISYNPQMNGILPASIGNFSTSLVDFGASGCSIRGVIPPHIGNLSSLLSLYLDQNKLTEHIPETMGELKQLQVLYLFDNQLKGYIPHDICQMSKLGELFLDGDMLAGSIPECFGEMKSLREISFASNKLNSTLPSNFLNLVDLISLDLSSNYLSGQLPYQIGSLKVVNRLDLSYNKFSGKIPNSIQGCESLEFLSLSNNKFNGSIPQYLGQLRGLRGLDLSNNNLFGFIPNSLVNLSLEYFNVSYNELEGEIPDGGCFANFSSESFSHNFNLCGTTRFGVTPCMKKHTKSRANLSLKYILPPVVSAIVAVVVVVVLVRRYKPIKTPPPADLAPGVAWRRVSYTELVRGTNSFSETNLLGRGSFGSVFRGTLSDGLDIAVKVFNLQAEGATKSFETESKILSGVRHRNLLEIVGCCSNMEFKALILEYMLNGSLEKWLHTKNYFLNLLQRLELALDVALALEYLHHGYTFPVVHCDIKPSNLLLDEDMTAHVGDFGIAKLLDDGETIVLTKTLATIGYAAPEYGSDGKISREDVYSYGILLLELFIAKKPTNDMFSEEMSLKEWVDEALQQNAACEVVARGLLDKQDLHFIKKERCVLSTFDLAMKCLAISPSERINMVEVAAALKKIKATFSAAETTRPY